MDFNVLHVHKGRLNELYVPVKYDIDDLVEQRFKGTVDEIWGFSDISKITPHEASTHHYVPEIWEISSTSPNQS